MGILKGLEHLLFCIQYNILSRVFNGFKREGGNTVISPLIKLEVLVKLAMNHYTQVPKFHICIS